MHAQVDFRLLPAILLMIFLDLYAAMQAIASKNLFKSHLKIKKPIASLREQFHPNHIQPISNKSRQNSKPLFQYNALAYAAAYAITERPGVVYNPLFSVFSANHSTIEGLCRGG